jgi:hypothetical protein
METEAKRLLRDCKRQKKDILRHGSDLEFMAKSERAKNIWAVRFALLHILRDGLCFHPPYSLVKNIGFGLAASNTRDATWDDPELPRSQAPVFTPPSPPVVETEGVAALWRKAIGEPERWTLIMRLRNARWRLAWLIRALVTRWRKNPSSLKS